MKKRVAVFFGGPSPEHDVSIATALQTFEQQAFDRERFEPFPVYVTTDGNWLVGDALRSQDNYIPSGKVLDSLQSVTLDVRQNRGGPARLIPTKTGMFGSPKPIEFDVAFLAFHGSTGENGAYQGLFEVAGIPYTGARVLAASTFMNKVSTKRMLAGTEVQTLPSVVLSRPSSGFMMPEADIVAAMGSVAFPVIVKPMNLGSSIGASRANNVAEVRAALLGIFKLDTQALLEPFVENLVEFNVAVRRATEGIVTSAIEKPKRHGELLDFKTKYAAGGSKAGGSKQIGGYNRGMLAMSRELSPTLAPEFEAKIRSWATTCFDRAYGNGVPRIDFLCNEATGELWLNEVNPCPGSFGFFLWEDAPKPLLFVELTSFLIDEALRMHEAGRLPADPVPEESRLKKRAQ